MLAKNKSILLKYYMVGEGKNDRSKLIIFFRR